MKQNSISTSPRSVSLYCFTPFVALATFVIEGFFSLYTIILYRKTLFGKLAALLLALLSIFQLSEYMLCSTAYPIFWTKLGYIAITFLPALGLHMVSLITSNHRYTRAAYLGAIMFASLILVTPDIFHGAVCTGKFVKFQTLSLFDYIYGIYYMSFIYVACILLVIEFRKKSKHSHTALWMLLGYASFIMPSYILNLYVASTKGGLPSIMCGFAVVLACIVVGRVVPLYSASAR